MTTDEEIIREWSKARGIEFGASDGKATHNEVFAKAAILLWRMAEMTPKCQCGYPALECETYDYTRHREALDRAIAEARASVRASALPSVASPAGSATSANVFTDEQVDKIVIFGKAGWANGHCHSWKDHKEADQKLREEIPHLLQALQSCGFKSEEEARANERRKVQDSWKELIKDEREGAAKEAYARGLLAGQHSKTAYKLGKLDGQAVLIKKLTEDKFIVGLLNKYEQIPDLMAGSYTKNELLRNERLKIDAIKTGIREASESADAAERVVVRDGSTDIGKPPRLENTNSAPEKPPPWNCQDCGGNHNWTHPKDECPMFRKTKPEKKVRKHRRNGYGGRL